MLLLNRSPAARRRRQRASQPTTPVGSSQVISDCPAAHRSDLVILQNGMLLPLLERHGLQGCTQALLYLSAGSDGGVVDSGRTVVTGRWACGPAWAAAPRVVQDKRRARPLLPQSRVRGRPPGKLPSCWNATRGRLWATLSVGMPGQARRSAQELRSPRCRWADALAEVLRSGGVACRPMERGAFLALMVEKLLWASTYWLLSAGLGGLPVGAVARQHGEAVEELATELLPLAQSYVLRCGAGMGLPPGSLDRVRAPDFRAASLPA